MTKFLGVLLTVGVLSMPALGMSNDTTAKWVGVVDGKGDFKVVQATNATTAGAGQLARVMAGDRVMASEEPVTIRLAEEGTVLVGRDSQVQMIDERVVRLESGTIAAGFRTGNSLTLQYDTISFTTIEAPATEGEATVVPTAQTGKSAVLGMEQVGPKLIRLSALNEMAIVRDIETQAQLAVVGANDTLDLVLGEAGKWMPGSRGLQPLAQDGQTPPPAGGGNAGGGGGGGMGGGLGLAGLGAGLAGTGVGIYGLNKASNLEDQNRKIKNDINDLEDAVNSLMAP